jgi:hypothetical protein
MGEIFMRNEVKTNRLKATLLGAAAGLFAVLSMGATAHAQGQDVLVIQGGTLVDGNGGAPVANSVIVVIGNRITAVGRSGDVQIPAGAEMIDASGKWITPGLIDSMSLGNWIYNEAYLHYGITSIVINAARGERGNAERDAINHGVYPGPRHFQSTDAARGRELTSVEATRARAQEIIDKGADFISAGDGMAPPEYYAAFAEVGHAAGKAVQMRCMGPLTTGFDCIEAGADVMLHTGNLGVDMNRDPEKWRQYIGLNPAPYCDMDPAKAQEAIESLIEHDTAVVPNLNAADRGYALNWARIELETHEIFEDPNLRAYYPEYAIHDVWDSVLPVEVYQSPDEIALGRCGFQNHAKFIGDLIAAGGHALTSMDDSQSAPGLGMLQEMAIFQEDANVPPMQIIQSGTSWPAHHYKLTDLGTIETGKLADIVILNADPTVDIMNLRETNIVIKDGEVIDHGYHAWYQGHMFSNDKVSYDRATISNRAWVEMLKANPPPGTQEPYMTVIGPTGNEVGIPTGGFGRRKTAGVGPVPNYSLSPTPGLEAMAPSTLLQGTPETEVTLRGVNFVVRSVVYIDGNAVPTIVDSDTQIRFTMPGSALANAGIIPIVVKNPTPVVNQFWGDTSNEAHMLVPFSFSNGWVVGQN